MNKRNGFVIIHRLLMMAKGHISLLIFSVLLGIAAALASVAPSVLAGYLLVKDKAVRSIFLLIILFALSRGIFTYLERYLSNLLAFKMLAEIRKKVFDKLRELAPARLENEDKSGLLLLLTSDIEKLKFFYSDLISSLIIAIVIVIMMFIFYLNINVTAAFIALAGYLIVALLVPVISLKMTNGFTEKAKKEEEENASILLDSINGIDEIIQYDHSDEKNKIHRAKDYFKDEYETDLIDLLSWRVGLSELTVLVCSCFMLIFLSNCYMDGSLSFAKVLMGTLAMFASFGSLLCFAKGAGRFEEIFRSGDRILSFLEEEAVTKEITEGNSVAFSSAALSNVTFSYDDKVNVLSDISYDFPKKKIVGIVGKSGSGKSTILRLLMRFWDVKKGNVLISEHDIREINTESLRGEEAFVSQDTFIFNDTVSYNIAIGKKGASYSEIRAAAKKADIDARIMALPAGYDTKIGDGFIELSAGERQKIGLARAFLHDSPLLLLDEPTSNLDALSEGMILKAVDEEAKDRTVILVSHRKSTVGIADTIYMTEEPVPEG